MTRYLIALLWLALFCAPVTTSAQGSYQVLHTFAEPPMFPLGRLVETPDGVLYGTAPYGGDFDKGAVFTARREGAGLFRIAVLHSFTGLDGANPSAGLVQGDDGNFYGTAEFGGEHGLGTVFRISPAGVLTVLHSFDVPEGAYPTGALIQAADGYFYGTLPSVRLLDGSTADWGAVFRLSRTGEFVVLHAFRPGFSGPEGPLEPRGALVQGPHGDFYGTTASGGGDALEYGSVFKMTPEGVVTVLHFFPTTQPFHPSGDLVLGTDGHFYGVAMESPSPYSGAVFRLALDGTFAFLHGFEAADGGSPRHITGASDGNFYGTLDKTVFRITPQGTVTIFRRLEELDALPLNLMQARDGRLYGSYGGRGLTFRGGVFGLSTDGQLTAFTGFYDLRPLHPTGRLLEGDDGNFYGTSCGGGVWNRGTVFKMTPAGVVSTVHSFFQWNGRCPLGGLVRGTDGQFYGTTVEGGVHDRGTVFRITTSGAFALLHVFDGSDGDRPFAGLMLGSDGHFYGTTYAGGANGLGTIFRITAAAQFTTLFSFADDGRGMQPIAGLVQATDGNLYGATTRGGPGPHFFGTVFRMTPAGDVISLPEVPLAQGQLSTLTQASDGDLYGTSAIGGGLQSNGSVFKIDTSGNSISLHSFTPAEGALPYSGVMQAQDGNFYGTMVGAGDQLRGDSGFGSVFRMTPAGETTILHAFTGGDDGGRAFAPLTQGSDGALYGSTLYGGPGNRGVIFKIAPGASQTGN